MAKKYSHAASRSHQFQQRKANPMYAGVTSGLTVMDGMQQPRTMPRNYKNYIQNGYGENDTLYKVIQYALNNGGAIPPVLYTDKTMQTEIKSHPLLDKLERPNDEMSGVFYRQSIIGYYLLSGNAFQYMNRANKAAGPPDELWILPPDKVRPIPDSLKGITGYEYADWPKEKNPILPQFIGHLRTWNPEDLFFGMSPVQVAAILVDQQTDARKWNLSLFQNFLKPPGAWTTDMLLSKNDRAKLEERVNQRMAGYQNAGKAPVLDGALKWQPSAVNPSEVDWLESQKYNSAAIANIFNMPPPLIGDTSASTYDNFQQAEVVSYTEFIFPILDALYALWNWWLVPLYPDLANGKAFLYYDKTSVEVISQIIQAQKNAEADRANKLWLSGLMMQDEAREVAGLPESPNGAGKIYRIGSVLVPADKMLDYALQSLTTPAAPPPAQPEPLDGAAEPADTQAPAGDESDQQEKPQDEQDDRVKAFDAAAKKLLAFGTSPAYHTKALDLSTKEEKDAYFQSMEATRTKWEDEYIPQIAAHFETERKAVVGALNASSAAGGLAGKAEGVVNDQSLKLEKIILSLYEDVCVDVGAQTQAEFSGEKAFVHDFLQLFGQSQLKHLLTLAGTKIKQITTTTVAKIRLELTDGVAQGEGIPELAKRIDSLYLDQIIPNRSKTIARSEVVESANYASYESAQSSGLELVKDWLSTPDDRTRPDHVAMDGASVAMDEPFVLPDGSKMMFPRDSSMGAAADEVINCRCVPVYRRAKVDQASNTDNEKRRRRAEYRQFMEAML